MKACTTVCPIVLNFAGNPSARHTVLNAVDSSPAPQDWSALTMLRWELRVSYPAQ